MIMRTMAALTTRCFLAIHRLPVGGARPGRRSGDRGQTTAEYALVIVGAAAVALLLLTWATGSGKITSLLDKMVDTVAGMVD